MAAPEAMMEVVSRHTFFPYLPGNELSPNSGKGRSRQNAKATARARRIFRGTVQMHIRSVTTGPDPEPPALAVVQIGQLSFTRRSDGLYRPWDPANAIYAWKPVFDGLQDVGWLKDDSWQHMILLPPWRRLVNNVAEEGLDIIVAGVAEPDQDEFRDLWTNLVSRNLPSPLPTSDAPSPLFT